MSHGILCLLDGFAYDMKTLYFLAFIKVSFSSEYGLLQI